MPAYVIVDVTINDPVAYEAYKSLTPASIAAYDGRFAVRGGTVETLEGNWRHGRIVVLEFPTTDRAKQWWASAEYAPAKSIRQQSAHTNMILVQGVDV